MTNHATAVRRVNRYGIDFHGRVYTHPNLGRSACPVGSVVHVRYDAYQPHTVEVFADGRWVCAAQSIGPLFLINTRLAAQRRAAAGRLADTAAVLQMNIDNEESA